MKHVREIGPVGTAGRVVGGLVAIAVPVALSGIGWWDVAGALVVLPLLALAAGALMTAVSRHSGGLSPAPVRSALVLVLVIALGIALTFVTPIDGSVAIWCFVGVSLLVAAWRGYAGCEVLAIPRAMSRRVDPIGCVLYSPVDGADSARST